jgi:tRNA nucleotidyltransferase (CCA-adding enzyme)
LGAESNDIDIAVSDMTGLTFAEHFVSFLEEEKGLPKPSISTVKANPDQSKHLETAKIKILDMDLDIVNLRSEEYASDSRIPTQMVWRRFTFGL